MQTVENFSGRYPEKIVWHLRNLRVKLILFVLRGRGQPAGKAPHLSSTLELDEWRVMRLGGTRPRSAAEAQGSVSPSGKEERAEGRRIQRRGKSVFSQP